VQKAEMSRTLNDRESFIELIYDELKDKDSSDLQKIKAFWTVYLLNFGGWGGAIMARKYSDKTLAAFVRFLDPKFTHAQKDVLFLSVSMPGEFDIGGRPGISGLRRASRVVTSLAERPEFGDTLDNLFNEAITERLYVFGEYNNRPTEELLRALKADSYEIKDGKLVPADSLEQELAQEINVLYERLHSLEMGDVQNNLEQAHVNFITGNHEACNAMPRTALESTLQHIAARFAGSVDKIPHARSYLTPVDVRKYLSVREFLSQDERQFVDALYGFASPHGSHPGMADEAESRLRRLMVVAWIQYCLQKLS
jgi:hypothetical protein